MLSSEPPVRAEEGAWSCWKLEGPCSRDTPGALQAAAGTEAPTLSPSEGFGSADLSPLCAQSCWNPACFCLFISHTAHCAHPLWKLGTGGTGARPHLCL